MSSNIELVSSVNMYSASHAFIHMQSVNACKFQSIFGRRIIVAMFRVWLRGVQWSGWVRLREFFYPTHHSGLKKSNPSQEFNPTQPTWIGLGRTHGLDSLFIYFLLLLLLNWAKKYISHLLPELINKIFMN